MPDTLCVVTPWYPSPNKPFQGSFVASMTAAAAPLAGRVEVFHHEDWIVPRGRLARRLLGPGYRHLAAAATRPALQPDGAWLSRVPVLVEPRRPWAEYARAVARSVREARRGRRFDASVVHAHVGLAGALVAVENAEPGARVVVTEHASYLDRVLEQPAARALYDELIHRADAWTCVSRTLRDQLVEVFPHHAGSVGVLPNAVDIDAISVREHPVTAPRRWIYVGSLIERKGPLRLVDAFAECSRRHPGLELTILGDGPQHDDVVARIEWHGLAGSARVLPPVPPAEVFRLLAEHDLLVHPSHHETFGMTPVEALATGTPVLVARYPAAEEILEGALPAAGRLFEIGHGHEEIVEGYEQLLASFDQVDALAAREVLRGRFGYGAVADQLTRLYQPGGTPGTQEPSP